ncbi:MAG: M67 family metallopeptidase [Prochlorococcus sp.]|mgnify:CR=1 FL=1|nr:M67 family metallopeptidase [Prochlorococcaceae cyanobacterium Fu_MAG_50]
MPSLLEFDPRCLIVLRQSLLAVSPEEGCALLLGDAPPELFNGSQRRPLQQTMSPLRVRSIWPCCNVWLPGMPGLRETSRSEDVRPGVLPGSRKTRFALDPREQLHAQRWARQWQWQVLGSAHSHPSSEPLLSPLDRRWVVPPSLMVIVSGSGRIGAWWVEEDLCAEAPSFTHLGVW